MKKKLFFLLFLLLPILASSQQAMLATNFTATGNNGGIKLIATGIAYNGALWTKTGTVAWPANPPTNASVSITPLGSNGSSSVTGTLNSINPHPAYTKVIPCKAQ